MASKLSANLPGTLRVDPRDPVNGKSTYELAVESGFEGTVEQWLESLKGVGIDYIDAVHSESKRETQLEISFTDGNVVNVFIPDGKDGEDGAKGDTGGYGPYTTLSRGGARLNIHCHGLTAGEAYAIHLYTVTRRRGNAMGEWRHPSNANTGVGFTGKGYARLAGQHYASDKLDTVIYPEVPSWMPNGGILQTEWEFTAESDTHKLTIDLEEWILPMLKPIDGEDFSRCALIGVNRGTKAPLLMRFKIVRLITGAVGESRNTLRIGVPVSGEIAYDVDGGIGEIYKSII